MKKLLMLISCLLIVLAGCSSEVNNGYSEGIIDLKEAITETKEEEFILYIYATSCVYCAKMKPVLNKYAEKTEGALPVYAYDMDDESVHEYVYHFIENGVVLEGTPTFVHYLKGEIVETHVGIRELDDIPVKDSQK